MSRLFFGLASLFYLFSCDDRPSAAGAAAPDRLPPQYYYYPKANVYFDSANKAYFFQTADSLTWQSAPQIPAVMAALMDKRVFIADTSEPVWRNNGAHRLVYSAVLYATANDTVAVKKPLRTIKKPDMETGDSASANQQKRKGFGGLLDKLFGRNKKKKETDKQDSGKRSR